MRAYYSKSVQAREDRAKRNWIIFAWMVFLAWMVFKLIERNWR